MTKAVTGKVVIGKKVPDFRAVTTDGNEWRLKEAAGSKVVVFFYPKDMTQLHDRSPRVSRPAGAVPARQHTSRWRLARQLCLTPKISY